MEDGRIKISLSLKRKGVLIYRDVFKILGNPGCFRFLIDEDAYQLAMQVCAFGDSGFHISPDFSEMEGRSYQLFSLEMIELLWDLCDWDPDQTYRVQGILCPDIHVIIFELSDAEVINDAEFDYAINQSGNMTGNQ